MKYVVYVKYVLYKKLTICKKETIETNDPELNYMHDS